MNLFRYYGAADCPKELVYSMSASHASSQYRTGATTRTPNRLCRSVLEGFDLYCSNKTFLRQQNDTALIEVPMDKKTYCVRGIRSVGRIMLKIGCVDENGVIVTDEKDETWPSILCGVVCLFADRDNEFIAMSRVLRPIIHGLLTDSVSLAAAEKSNIQEAAIILCDNIYRRSQAVCSVISARIVTVTTPLRQEDLAVDFPLTNAEQYVCFHSTGIHSENSIQNFSGRYAYQERQFTDEEKRLIPVIDENYVIPEFVEKTCRRFKATSKFPAPMRTALFCGPAGAGKTEGSRAVFAGLGLPYMHYTCHDTTEILDLIGQVMPSNGQSAISLDEIRKMLALPSTEEVANDPQGAYTKVYGTPAPAIVDEGGLFEEIIRRTVEEVRKNAGGNGFVYIESDFIRAVRNGYGFELQEVDMIKRSSLIVGLNALLESGHNSFITLPTGETVTKHPDCTIIFTDNGCYEGSRRLNQAILSRMSFCLDPHWN